MHKLLSRLVRRHLPEDIPSQKLEAFLESITQAFDQSDQDRLMLERSLTLVSGELTEINSKLSSQLSEVETYQLDLEKSLVEQAAIIHAIPEAIFSVKTDGAINQINKSGRVLFGETEDKIKALKSEESISLLLNKFKDPNKFLKLISKIKKDNLAISNDLFETKDNKYFECHTIPEILDGRYIGRVWCFRDVTDARKSQEKLKYQAFYDSLTKLPNRALLLESIDHAIAVAKRNYEEVAVLFIDLDDFKKINDTAGHEEGDRFLIEISNQIKSSLRKSDILGRLGGDEFVVVLEKIKHREQIESVHNKIFSLFSRPFPTQDNQYFISCSIGISLYPQDGSQAEELIRKADMAMYQAKRSGKNTFHYFDNSLEHIAIHRVSIEAKLRRAIAEDQFILHYQPKIDLESNRIVGAEALIRWQEPDGELIFPDNFIPIAEDTGIIRDITQWVFQKICQNLNQWQSTELKGIPVSINISAIDFSDPSFLTQANSFIDKYNVKPNLLELELTESVFFNDINKVKDTIAQLKLKNILISIDDFGTGYSSFSYLHDLDIDYLKIDKSFIQSLHDSEKSKAIVKSIIDLGENLGIKVVAEGIETEKDHTLLLSEGCNIGQGYHYSRPIPEDKFTELIMKQNITEVSLETNNL